MKFVRNLNDLSPEHRNVGLIHVSPGSRTVLSEFERAVRSLAMHGIDGVDEYVRTKAAVVRRIRRLEGSLPPDPRGRRRKS